MEGLCSDRGSGARVLGRHAPHATDDGDDAPESATSQHAAAQRSLGAEAAGSAEQSDEAEPVVLWRTLPMLTHMLRQTPAQQPMKDIMDRAMAAEADGSVLNAL